MHKNCDCILNIDDVVKRALKLSADNEFNEDYTPIKFFNDFEEWVTSHDFPKDQQDECLQKILTALAPMNFESMQ